MPKQCAYNLGGLKEVFLETFDAAVCSNDHVVLDASGRPITVDILGKRALNPTEKEFVLAFYEKLTALAASGKLQVYSRGDLVIHTVLESINLRKKEHQFYLDLHPHIQALQSVPESILSEGSQQVAATLEDALTYYARAFDIELQRKRILKNIARTTAAALQDGHSYAIVTTAEAYLALIDALFGVSVDVFTTYDRTSPIRDVLRTPRLSIVHYDSGAFDIARDNSKGIPPHPRWGELNERQRQRIFTDLYPLAEKLVHAHSKISGAQALIERLGSPIETDLESAPDISNVCDQSETYEASPASQPSKTRLRRPRHKREQDIELIAQQEFKVEKSWPKKKKPAEKKQMPDYITASSRETLETRFGFDPEEVTLKKSLLTELAKKAGFEGKDIAPTVEGLGFSERLEFGKGRYFRYREKDVRAFLGKIAKNGS